MALLNRGSSAMSIGTTAAAAGLPATSSYTVRNLWTHTSGRSGGSIHAEVPGDGTVLLRVSAG